MILRTQHHTGFSVYKLTRCCTLLACHQAVVVNVSDLLHPPEPSECVAAQAETFWQSSPFMLQRYGLGWWALQLPAVRFIVGSSSV